VKRGVVLCLGTFSDVKEAALAYNKAALEHYGPHAALNDVNMGGVGDGN